MTEAELRLRYFSRSASRSVINCPIETPFASGNTCINCEGNSPIWNMRLQRCVRCPNGFTFKESTKTCVGVVSNSQSETQIKVVTPIVEEEVAEAPI